LHLLLYRVSLAGTTIVEAHSFGNSDSAGFHGADESLFRGASVSGSNLGDRALAVDGIIDRTTSFANVKRVALLQIEMQMGSMHFYIVFA
jgi:hypothetical protein